jgi:hypothetical protein
VLPEKFKKQPSQPREPSPVAFLSGEIVPISGIWLPDHQHSPRAPELWLRKQTPFPPCPICGLTANFSLLQEILHISEDPDFQ